MLLQTARSFQVDALWMQKLQTSAQQHGWTWLHPLHVGTIELEIGNAAAAKDHFTKSMAMQPSAHAARALAIFCNATDAPRHFEAAWTAWKAVDSSDPAKFRLGADLAKEYASWLLSQASASDDWHALMAFVDRVERDCGSFCIEQDALQLAQANLAVHFSKDPHKGIAIIRRNCFPTFSNQRGDVNTVWWAANVAIEEKRLGHPMSKMETIRLRRKLGCDGDLLSTTVSPPSGGPHASSGKGGSCVVGPPNIGYPY